MEDKVSHDGIGVKIADFVLRNGFGLLCFLSGLTYQIYQMSGRTKRLSRAQCIMAVTMWALSGLAVVIALYGVEMNRLIYGLVCWATPIVIKPFADKVAEKSPVLSEKLIGWIESVFDKRNSNKTTE